MQYNAGSAAHIVSVTVSLNNLQKLHDSISQRESFACALDAIRVLKDDHMVAYVIMTLNHDSAMQLEDLYQLYCDLDIGVWKRPARFPMGKAPDSGIDFKFVITFVGDHIFTISFMMGIVDNIGYFMEKEGYLRGICVDIWEASNPLLAKTPDMV